MSFRARLTIFFVIDRRGADGGDGRAHVPPDQRQPAGQGGRARRRLWPRRRAASTRAKRPRRVPTPKRSLAPSVRLQRQGAHRSVRDASDAGRAGAGNAERRLERRSSTSAIARAIAPGSAILRIRRASAGTLTVTVSELTASQYARELAAPGVAVVVRSGPNVSRRPAAAERSLVAGERERNGRRQRLPRRRLRHSAGSAARQ